MKIISFERYRKKGASDHEMLVIIKQKVLPIVGVRFDDDLAFRVIRFTDVTNLKRYHVWEVYLTVLVKELKIPQKQIEDILTAAIKNEST